MSDFPEFWQEGAWETCTAATDAALAELKPPARMRGMVAVIRRLAEAIDQIDDLGMNPSGKLDNVSMPTYLKYAEALGMYSPAAKQPAAKAGGPAASDPPVQGGLRGILGGKAG